MRTITLECDDLDFDTIQAEIAKRQLRRDEHGTIIPDGESNLPAAIIAEVVRDIDDYRILFDLKG